MMGERDSRKFDPAMASTLDAAERDVYLPDGAVTDLLELTGAETVLDYGAGTGRISLVLAERLPKGRVVAVDESPEMIVHLSERLASVSNAEVIEITGNAVPLDDGSVDRVLAVNLLHEVRSERALEEMHRLLRPDGFLLVIDWDREGPSEPGPPTHLRYKLQEAIAECEKAGFQVHQPLSDRLPYHFVLRAYRAGRAAMT